MTSPTTDTPSGDCQLSRALQVARHELRLTQEQLAARIGVSLRTVSRWEQGTSEPRSLSQKKALATIATGTAGGGLLSALGLMPMGGPVALPLLAGAFARRKGQHEDKGARELERRLCAAASRLKVTMDALRSELVPLLQLAREAGLNLENLPKALPTPEGAQELQTNVERPAEGAGEEQGHVD